MTEVEKLVDLFIDEEEKKSKKSNKVKAQEEEVSYRPVKEKKKTILGDLFKKRGED